LGKVRGGDNRTASSGVNIIPTFVRNKNVKRTLKVVNSLREMFVARFRMGRRCPHENRGKVSSMRDTINQGLIL
jgi:hypothetical protein